MFMFTASCQNNTFWILILLFAINKRNSFIDAGSSSSSSYGCGLAEIGNITCGVVDAVTSIDVTLYPPSDTTYEIVITWQDGQDPVDTETRYYTDISSAKTVTLSAMFGEPDTQSVSITVRAYNENYVSGDDQYANNKWRADEACYEATKPPTDSDIWSVVVNYKYCSVSADFSPNQASWYSLSEVEISSTSTTEATAASSSIAKSSSHTNFWSMSAFGFLCILGIATLVAFATLIIGTKNQRTIDVPKNELLGTTVETTTPLESSITKSSIPRTLYVKMRQGNICNMA